MVGEGGEILLYQRPGAAGGDRANDDVEPSRDVERGLGGLLHCVLVFGVPFVQMNLGRRHVFQDAVPRRIQPLRRTAEQKQRGTVGREQPRAGLGDSR